MVITDISKPDDFISHYAKMLPDSDSNELQKILEMRSMKRSEQSQIIQLYRQNFEAAGLTNIATTNSMPSATAFSTSGIPSSFSAVVSSLAADAGISDSSMRRLEKLVKKKF